MKAPTGRTAYPLTYERKVVAAGNRSGGKPPQPPKS
jgi:hypothetical protein